jgi:hypothetical protein
MPAALSASRTVPRASSVLSEVARSIWLHTKSKGVSWAMAMSQTS